MVINFPLNRNCPFLVLCWNCKTLSFSCQISNYFYLFVCPPPIRISIWTRICPPPLKISDKPLSEIRQLLFVWDQSLIIFLSSTTSLRANIPICPANTSLKQSVPTDWRRSATCQFRSYYALSQSEFHIQNNSRLIEKNTFWSRENTRVQ